jgi:putative oxidoreductase
MSQFQPLGLLAGRLLLAYLFIVSGYGKIAGFAGAAKYMAAKGMAMVEPLLVATIVIELVGGLMIAVGFKARWAAWVIFLFLIPVSVIFHPAWADPAQAIAFNKNLAIMGGMLYLALIGPGRLSLDKS